ncbi:hypothetical protein F5146DRAFT_1118349 [Armillaria mellea]|nr:hypothetical protein F5146DRAFT_1118349 [Armillaria mellea]
MDVVFLLTYIYKDILREHSPLYTSQVFDSTHSSGGRGTPSTVDSAVRLDYTLSLLHTSSRFNCTPLRQKCVGTLSTLFRDFSTRTTRPPVVCEAIGGEESSKTWAIKALNIFEECHVPAFLPMACYYVAQLPEEHIRDGVPISPGNRVVKLRVRARKVLTCCREWTWRWLSQPRDAHRLLCERPEPDEPLDTFRGVLNRVGKHLKKLGFFDEHRTDLLEILHPVV